ncbi:MAG: UDP-N-acetylmuramoyl-tripeptide--D-alanyl-D-alanine ligase [Synoicihabitans sp.]
MPRFNPQHLAAWTSGQWSVEPVGALCGFNIDSRTIGEGEVFVALRTAQRDGHAFVQAAKEAGAAAALVTEHQGGVELPQLVVADTLTAFQTIAREHRRLFKGPVVGITGSAGKTSTKNILSTLLGKRTLATAGNLNNHLGVPLTLTRLDNERHDFGVIEAGISEVGEMSVLAAMIEPDAAIVTLVDYAHTEGLGGIAGVAREKSVLPAAVAEEGDRLFPVSVARLQPFQDLPPTKITIKREEVLSGNAPDTAVRYLVTSSGDQSVLSIAAGMGTPELYAMTHVSDGMAQNAVLAITLARRLGIETSLLRERLADWKPSAMRGEVREVGGRLIYLDCYNANPASMNDAAHAFATQTESDQARLWILGGMEELGADSDAKHRELGEALPVRAADIVWLIGTGAEQTKAGLAKAGHDAGQILILDDLADARTPFADWRGPVFIKGSRRYRLETILAEEAALVH